jgi:hypothetical protein
VITKALSALLIVLGAIVLARTLLEGVGGGLGFLLGGLLVLAGALRLYVSRRESH